MSEQGIGMEIEFNDDAHEATGAKLCLQLKSGDSYTRKRRSDGADVFSCPAPLGLMVLRAVDPGRRSQTRFALGWLVRPLRGQA